MKTEYPVVISASRRTDIPACHAAAFLARLKMGYTIVRYNGTETKVSFEKTQGIVFWTKHCSEPMHDVFEWLYVRGIASYVQYTLNDYEKEGLEPNIPPLEERLKNFHEFGCGLSHLIWRFDPILLSNTLSMEEVFERWQIILKRIAPHTKQCVVSFADVDYYPRVKAALLAKDPTIREPNPSEQRELLLQMVRVLKDTGIRLVTCAENISVPGVYPSKCVDGEKLIKIFGDLHMDPLLVDKGVRCNIPTHKDPKQRKICGCTGSTDVGHYRTCKNGCLYCYAM